MYRERIYLCVIRILYVDIKKHHSASSSQFFVVVVTVLVMHTTCTYIHTLHTYMYYINDGCRRFPRPTETY